MKDAEEGEVRSKNTLAREQCACWPNNNLFLSFVLVGLTNNLGFLEKISGILTQIKSLGFGLF